MQDFVKLYGMASGFHDALSADAVKTEGSQLDLFAVVLPGFFGAGATLDQGQGFPGIISREICAVRCLDGFTISR